MAAERHNAAFIVGAALGGLVGAVVTLWFAPQAGAQTRSQIGERWDEAGERLAQGVADIDRRTRDLLPREEESPAVVVSTVESSGRVDAEIDRVVVVEPDPVPAGPRPGPIVDGTVVADPDLATALDSAPPLNGSPSPTPTGGIDPRAGTG